MLLSSKEHYDMMEFFERQYYHLRLDREKDKELWAKGRIYESGETNELFLAFRGGAAYGKAVAQ